MKVLGIDASKSCSGVAVYDGTPSRTIAWTLRPPSERRKDILRTDKHLWKDGPYCAEWMGWYAMQWVNIIGEHRPDYVFIEAPRPPVQQRERMKPVIGGSDWAGQAYQVEKVGGTNFQATFDLCAGFGVILSRLGIMGYGAVTTLVPVGEWRRSVSIAPSMKRAEAKRMAKVMCDRLGIPAGSADAAEAALIARYGFEIRSKRVDLRDDLFRKVS